MSQPTQQRPPQVTLASGIVMFASFIVLVSAWERITTLGSLESQTSIQEFLAEAPFSSLGLDVSSASEILRIMCMVAAASACATAILGWFVRTPDRSARLGLSIFAVPVFVAGLPAGGLAGSFVAAGAAMLWVMPAREWFATGRWTPPPPAPEKVARGKGTSRRTPLGGRGDQSAPSQPPTQAPSWPATPPPATRPFGEHRPAVGAPTAAQAPPAAWPHPDQHQHQQHLHDRPGAMVAAFVITVVTAGGLLTLSLLWLAIAGLSPEFLRSVLEQQQPDMFDEGLTFQQVRETVLAYASAFVVWGSVALVLAGFAMARRDWARRGLMIIAAFSAGGCLAFIASTPLVVIPAAAAVATIVCLRRIEVRRWFAPPSH
ncbi:hypothetical protein SAMN05192575_101835 [Nocardioides alpinus]|uniref:Uncharacterized protein n=1 Tax=Nocardioides alpinus TaxID=748909 RepID=A0A1I0W9Q5_9ACTN|nr:hypothetical protein [Nocardioides alpinus]PKH37789.1 hypothetical protein CXG46_20530 [Nocardioides alpinus]SFA85495.1 hypothetical protein SAMN05192575_101835 [Nocardioides alpinus]